MKNKKIIYILSILIIALSITVALTGLLSKEVKIHPNVVTAFDENIELYQKGLYAKDSVSMATQALAQDKVTLILGIPLMLISLCLIKNDNKKGIFLLTGTVGYFLYTYTSYAFLMIFNSFYLLYVFIMALSFYNFILCIDTMNTYKLKEEFTDKFPKKSLRIFLYITALVIGVMWLGRIIPALVSKTAPFGLEHYSTLGIQTLDLGFIVPACAVTGYLLKREKQSGYLFSIVLVVKAVTMAAAVSTMGISMKLQGVEVSTGELCVFPILFIICAYFMMKIFKTVKC